MPVLASAAVRSGSRGLHGRSRDAPERLPGKHVTREDFNTGTFTDIWPLTVDEGTLFVLGAEAAGRDDLRRGVHNHRRHSVWAERHGEQYRQVPATLRTSGRRARTGSTRTRPC